MADNGSGRLDRIERAMERWAADHEQFREEHKRLLTAQIVLSDIVEKLSKKVDKLAEHDAKQDELIAEGRERSKALDERVAALVSAMGEWIRANKSSS